MGEYALHKGQRVKIGTCENMYYLRADQAAAVTPERGSVDPVYHGKSGAIRFRFPWPDEDRVEPGAFERYDRFVGLHGVAVPSEVEHTTIQFRHDAGYLVSLPCPESTEPQPYKIHRNGFSGAVLISQQKWLGGRLITVARCGGCGVPYRLETLEAAKPVVEACEMEARGAERTGDLPRALWWTQVANRILAGYR